MGSQPTEVEFIGEPPFLSLFMNPQSSHLCVIKMLIAYQTLVAADFEVRSPKAQMN